MSIRSLLDTGTILWLDGVDPSDVENARAWGATGATSNPTIVSRITGSGRLDARIRRLVARGLTDDQVAWSLGDGLVAGAQRVFLPAWEGSGGDDGYVSFELDPLIEDAAAGLSHAERVERYVDLGTRWSLGHRNRMIKVPATPAGIGALEALAAAGVTINVTLMFTERQYRLARDAIWRGAQRRAGGLGDFKSVYSVFVSRLDAYAAAHVPALSPAARREVGVANAKRIWRENAGFWKGKGLRLRQEVVFASTGVKDPADPPDRYARALAGGGLQADPVATLGAIEVSPEPYEAQLDQVPPAQTLAEIDGKVEMGALEKHLTDEGIAKFAGAQRATLAAIAGVRAAMPGSRPPPVRPAR